VKYRLLDLLACPEDKSWPLELEITEKEIESEELSLPHPNEKTEVICQYYCSFKKYFLVKNPNTDAETSKPIEEIRRNITIEDCKRCFKIEIISGKLYCNKSKEHEYEIKEGIPIMLSKEQKKELYGT